MEYSFFIAQKALEFEFDLNEPAGILLVCHCLLEGLWYKFGDDLRKVLQDINRIESELREIKNVFDIIQYIQIASVLEQAGYIHSVGSVQKWVNAAYSLVCGAAMVLENGGNTAGEYTSAVGNLTSCRTQIGHALRGFCLN